MKILVIGNGGREDCLCWKLRTSKKVSKIFCLPGNPGTSRWAENVAGSVEDISAITQFAVKNSIDLCIIGPEVPLSLGVVDALQQNNIKVFGPTQAAAQLESSKIFAKEIMIAAKVPTAGYKKVVIKELVATLANMQVPFVLKADGLAAGKGVVVCLNIQEVLPAIEHLTNTIKAESIVIEEYLSGVEVSCIYACHGLKAVALSTAHDYKRIFDNDQGANTGGMGTVSPSPRITEKIFANVLTEVILPTLTTMHARGTPFSGFLYAGLMLLPNGSYKVLEFNTRLGDPETQVLLPRLETDLIDLIESLMRDTPTDITFTNQYKVCLVLASRDYPQSSSKGDVIEGIEFAEQHSGMIFHSGTALDSRGKLVTNGGRVLNVVGSGESLADAKTNAYRAADMIQFSGRQMRRDIGVR